MTSPRWPGWVYRAGEEPDARFTFANERTFLAWIRTSLAFLAAGVAVDVVDLSLSDRAQQSLAVLLVTLGLLAAPMSWLRWARAEQALRQGRPLPSGGLAVVLAVGVFVVAAVLLVSL